jgi:hypothetical protein
MAITAKDVSSMSEQRVASRRYLRVLAILALGLLLVWQIITRSLVAYLASASPETALALAPSDPETLLNLIDRELTGRLEAAQRAQPSPAASDDHAPLAATPPNTTDGIAKWAQMGARATAVDQLRGSFGAPANDSTASGFHPSDEQMRAWAELALVHDPLNARALRILGQLAAADGDEESAEKFMQAAASRSLHERLPIYYLMQKRLQQKNYPQAVYFADALLRTTPEVLPNLMPALAFMAETPSAAGELKSVLSKNPPWRAGFLAALPSSVSDARTPLDVLLAIKDSSTPTTADLRSYLDFLVSKKLYELAYYTWLQFLPVEQLSKVGNLYNGSFELTPSGLPFDWVIASGAGVTTEILPRTDADGENALFISFEQGRVEFNGVTQLLMLAPGDYEFKGKFKGELIGPRGLKWRIACAGGSAPLGESAMMIGAHPIWKDIEFSFTVPSGECRAQQLRLDLDARMSSEQLITGSVWIDELQISRRAAAGN